MASTRAPSTPDGITPPPTIRRAFTLPPRMADLQQSHPPNREANGQTAETLFAHHAAKIVAFSPIPISPKVISSTRRASIELDNEVVGTLPWASYTERIIAAGPLSIYRVHGSVAFLNSGETLHAIFPKSRCWCVDGETKFVLRIRQDSYWRIELPNTCAEDRTTAEELKQILPKVLQYETTACPFKRGFTVDLPEPPKTPVRKRPWKPSQRSFTMTEMHTRRHSTNEMTTLIESDISSDESRNQDCDSNSTDDTGVAHTEISIGGQEDVFDALKTPTRPKVLSTGRAITAPPQLTLKTTPPSNTNRAIPQPNLPENDTSSLSSSIDSFHSFHSFHSPISPLPPSPPYSNPSSPLDMAESVVGIDIPWTPQHKRDKSDLTVTAESSRSWDMTTPKPNPAQILSLPLSPRTPALTDDTVSQDDILPEVETPSPDSELRRRPTHSRRRTHSPLPSPANLYSPRTRMSGHHLTTAILQKTCSMLLGPPIQLVALMLNIAKRIINGTMRGSSFGYGESGQKIPCTWDYTDTDDDAEEFWEEDDYGISLGRIPYSKSKTVGDLGGSWEID